MSSCLVSRRRLTNLLPCGCRALADRWSLFHPSPTQNRPKIKKKIQFHPVLICARSQFGHGASCVCSTSALAPSHIHQAHRIVLRWGSDHGNALPCWQTGPQDFQQAPTPAVMCCEVELGPMVVPTLRGSHGPFLQGALVGEDPERDLLATLPTPCYLTYIRCAGPTAHWQSWASTGVAYIYAMLRASHLQCRTCTPPPADSATHPVLVLGDVRLGGGMRRGTKKRLHATRRRPASQDSQFAKPAHHLGRCPWGSHAAAWQQDDGKRRPEPDRKA